MTKNLEPPLPDADEEQRNWKMMGGIGAAVVALAVGLMSGARWFGALLIAAGAAVAGFFVAGYAQKKFGSDRNVPDYSLTPPPQPEPRIPAELKQIREALHEQRKLDENTEKLLTSVGKTQNDAGRGKRLDHVLAEILENNDGVFMGENHLQTSVKHSITKLLPYLKARGVGTISIEMPQDHIDMIKRSETFEAFLARDSEERGSTPSARVRKMLGVEYELVRTADKLGMVVLGHENPEVVKAIDAMMNDKEEMLLLTPEERKRRIARIAKWAMDEKNVNDRNEWAADYIGAHKKGKVIVIGGALHSGDYLPGDVSLSDYVFRAKNGTLASIGMLVKAAYHGLDVKLGVPAIDYREEHASARLGATNRKSGKFHDYETSLSPHLNGSPFPYGNPPSPAAMSPVSGGAKR